MAAASPLPNCVPMINLQHSNSTIPVALGSLCAPTRLNGKAESYYATFPDGRDRLEVLSGFSEVKHSFKYYIQLTLYKEWILHGIELSQHFQP